MPPTLISLPDEPDDLVRLFESREISFQFTGLSEISSFYTSTCGVLRFSILVVETYDFTNAKRHHYGLLGSSTTPDF
jgi:hypothetical protein